MIKKKQYKEKNSLHINLRINCIYSCYTMTNIYFNVPHKYASQKVIV